MKAKSYQKSPSTVSNCHLDNRIEASAGNCLKSHIEIGQASGPRQSPNKSRSRAGFLSLRRGIRKGILHVFKFGEF